MLPSCAAPSHPPAPPTPPAVLSLGGHTKSAAGFSAPPALRAAAAGSGECQQIGSVQQAPSGIMPPLSEGFGDEDALRRSLSVPSSPNPPKWVQNLQQVCRQVRSPQTGAANPPDDPNPFPVTTADGSAGAGNESYAFTNGFAPRSDMISGRQAGSVQPDVAPVVSSRPAVSHQPFSSIAQLQASIPPASVPFGGLCVPVPVVGGGLCAGRPVPESPEVKKEEDREPMDVSVVPERPAADDARADETDSSDNSAAPLCPFPLPLPIRVPPPARGTVVYSSHIPALPPFRTIPDIADDPVMTSTSPHSVGASDHLKGVSPGPPSQEDLDKMERLERMMARARVNMLRRQGVALPPAEETDTHTGSKDARDNKLPGTGENRGMRPVGQKQQMRQQEQQPKQKPDMSARRLTKTAPNTGAMCERPNTRGAVRSSGHQLLSVPPAAARSRYLSSRRGVTLPSRFHLTASRQPNRSILVRRSLPVPARKPMVGWETDTTPDRHVTDILEKAAAVREVVGEVVGQQQAGNGEADAQMRPTAGSPLPAVPESEPDAGAEDDDEEDKPLLPKKKAKKRPPSSPPTTLPALPLPAAVKEEPESPPASAKAPESSVAMSWSSGAYERSELTSAIASRGWKGWSYVEDAYGDWYGNEESSEETDFGVPNRVQWEVRALLRGTSDSDNIDRASFRLSLLRIEAIRVQRFSIVVPGEVPDLPSRLAEIPDDQPPIVPSTEDPSSAAAPAATDGLVMREPIDRDTPPAAMTVQDVLIDAQPCLPQVKAEPMDADGPAADEGPPSARPEAHDEGRMEGAGEERAGVEGVGVEGAAGDAPVAMEVWPPDAPVATEHPTQDAQDDQTAQRATQQEEAAHNHEGAKGTEDEPMHGQDRHDDHQHEQQPPTPNTGPKDESLAVRVKCEPLDEIKAEQPIDKSHPSDTNDNPLKRPPDETPSPSPDPKRPRSDAVGGGGEPPGTAAGYTLSGGRVAPMETDEGGRGGGVGGEGVGSDDEETLQLRLLVAKRKKRDARGSGGGSPVQPPRIPERREGPPPPKMKVEYPSEHHNFNLKEYYYLLDGPAVERSLRLALNPTFQRSIGEDYFDSVPDLSPISLAQWCPTVFWNVIRLGGPKVDEFLATLVPTSRTVRRRRNQSERFRQHQQEMKQHQLEQRRRKDRQEEFRAQYEQRREERHERELQRAERLNAHFDKYLQKLAKRGNKGRKKPKDTATAAAAASAPAAPDTDKDREGPAASPANTQGGEDDAAGAAAEASPANGSQGSNGSGRSRRMAPHYGAPTTDTEKEQLVASCLEPDGRIKRSLTNLSSYARNVVYRTCLERGIRAPVVVKYDRDTGRGILAGKDIHKDDFVFEYQGELIPQTVAAEREKTYATQRKGCYMYYFALNGNWCIDATSEQYSHTWGPGRLVNHSKQRPNLLSKSLTDTNGTPRVFFVAKEDIPKGAELLIDYGETNPRVLEANPWLVNT